MRHGSKVLICVSSTMAYIVEVHTTMTTFPKDYQCAWQALGHHGRGVIAILSHTLPFGSGSDVLMYLILPFLLAAYPSHNTHAAYAVVWCATCKQRGTTPNHTQKGANAQSLEMLKMSYQSIYGKC